MNTHRSLGVAFLVFLIAFTIKAGLIIRALSSWDVFWNPPTVGDMFQAFAYGLIAAAIALGINIRELLTPLGLFGGLSKDTPQPPAGGSS